MNIYIFDLDSTLANIDHRLPYLHTRDDGPDAPFNALCVKDAPILHMIDIFNNLRMTSNICVIWTGRTEGVRSQTAHWLHGNTDLNLNEIINPKTTNDHDMQTLKMRPLGDTRPDFIIKQEWLLSLEPWQRERIVCAFDDRDRVVKMYRANGVPCLQVAEGNF